MLNKNEINQTIIPSGCLESCNLMFLNAPDSEFAEFIQTCDKLVHREPIILHKINSDLDKHAIKKKEERLLDKHWDLSQTKTLPNIAMEFPVISIDAMRLQGGRPRMSAYLTYFFLMIRGYCGGVKSSQFELLLRESKSIQLLLHNCNDRKMPGRSTISDNINGVSVETRQFILNAQIRMIIGEELDDFNELTIDSTSVSGNTTWPTDSGILTALVRRIFSRGNKLHLLGISNIAERRFPSIIKAMNELSKQINFTVKKPNSNGKRKKLYRKLLKEANGAHKAFVSELDKVKLKLISVNIEPSRFEKLKRLIDLMSEDVESLFKVIEYCSQRIFKNQSTPSSEKVLSLSDKSAGFIKKGDREPVIGYKPQIGRSKNGFISAFSVPQGNAADSGEFLNIVRDGIGRTGVIPSIISTDDGYANRPARKELLSLGVKSVSISGSKGKKMTGEEDWESEEYIKIRNDRSAVESLMFTIKYCFDFGRVMRRGIDNVRAELLEKVLAYNFCRIIEIRNKNCLLEIAA